MKRCVEGNTFDIVKKAEVDKGARKVKSEQKFKGNVRMTFE